MPRPSLKDIRSEEILSAYAVCISHYGVDGATQEKIASEAGVKRSILRHYLGNRDEMLTALVEYIEQKLEQDTEIFFKAIPETHSIEGMLDLLFDAEYQTDYNTMLLLQALSSVSFQIPDMAQKFIDWSDQFVERIKDELTKVYPNASKKSLFDVAFGVVSIYFNLDSFANMDIPDRWRKAAKNSARNLIFTLEQ